MLVISVLLVAGGAQAQPPPEPIEPEPAPEPAPEVRPLEVDDPLLNPPRPPRRVLSDWKDALTLVSARSTDLVIAVQEIERARGGWREALGRALLVVTATGNVTHHLLRNEGQRFIPGQGLVPGTIPPSPVLTGVLSAEQPVLAVRDWHAIGTAERFIDAARLRAEDARRLILGGVGSAILAAVTAERLGEVHRSGLKSALERLELERRRTGHGAGTRLGLLRFEQDVARARADVISGNEAIRRAREALGLALGLSEPVAVATVVNVADIEQLLRRTCRIAEVDMRADVLAAEKELEIAERVLTEAGLLLVPMASVHTIATASNERLANGDNLTWIIGANLTVPIYDGGVRYGVRRRAEAEREQQRARLDQTRREARVEVAQTTRGKLVAEEQREVARARRDFAREASRLTTVAFQQGAATSFELVETARDQRDAELELVLREFELTEARIQALLAAASCHF